MSDERFPMFVILPRKVGQVLAYNLIKKIRRYIYNE